ncbi:MAG: TraR/DksA C4-type zinc finger protein [Methylobacter sp.]|uniref:TraR/DksA C4-type zinc finger protein n=1 Tax=Candidatus Methylobacter titanis TaxID=3053457 RepID=A0AA43Q413_9GAMM|nr:TraR/DksA C4-type zinc finger protein [Candidatus Methylobacter titanis]
MSDEADRGNDTASFMTDLALRQHRRHTELSAGEDSAECCEACGMDIPELRRATVPGVTLCVDCKREQERKERMYR